MQLGKIVQHVVSTKKNEKLTGCKLLIVQMIKDGKLTDQYTVAIDSVGAGVGEVVIVATGSAARIGTDREAAPIDAAIVGIIDEPDSVLVNKA
ncbi:EutN/CcmL family microcompartment protein [Treponema primitia]|uniref:EutN/CcmL family microcompartment protein n=1 Tax=Treponema primitia TaxID=88058 RepID=UPI0002554F24|nr:EutN/CcmL family microcompartment protein [Treponema primitia]